MGKPNEKQFIYTLLKWYKLSRIKEFNADVDKEKAWEAIITGIDRKHERKLFPTYIAAAVFIGVLISMVTLWRYSVYTDYKEVLAKVGKSKAVLYADNGAAYNLEMYSGDIVYNNTLIARNSQDYLIYNAKDLDSACYNTIEVPRGGEYKVQLVDHSKVTINSVSKIRVPVGIPDDVCRREVTLYNGEAFFEVAKDESKPFIVKTPNCKIEVLGTKFDVEVVEDKTYVTLVEGSVAVRNGSHREMLLPGERMVISEGIIGRCDVDVDQYVGWTKGIFEYYDTPLEDIVRQLSLWYDVDFRFASKGLETIRFAGVIIRKQSLAEAISVLEKVGNVHFDVRKDYILIKK